MFGTLIADPSYGAQLQEQKIITFWLRVGSSKKSGFVLFCRIVILRKSERSIYSPYLFRHGLVPVNIFYDISRHIKKASPNICFSLETGIRLVLLNNLQTFPDCELDQRFPSYSSFSFLEEVVKSAKILNQRRRHKGFAR